MQLCPNLSNFVSLAQHRYIDLNFTASNLRGQVGILLEQIANQYLLSLERFRTNGPTDRQAEKSSFCYLSTMNH